MTRTTNRMRTVDAPITGLVGNNRCRRMVTRDQALDFVIDAAERLKAQAHDMMLTTNNRLTAGPPATAPDLGTLYDGTGARRVVGASVEELRRRIRLAHPNLTEQDVDKCVTAAMELSSGSRAVPIGKEGGARVNDAHRRIAAQVAEIDAVQAANKALWDNVHAENDLHYYGHVR
jgi:hypothetical protein